VTDDPLLTAINGALDAAAAAGRIKPSGIDPVTRATFFLVMAMGAPFHLPPLPPQPVQTVCLVMDLDTQRRLARACGSTSVLDARCVTYQGVPIKVDPQAAGRIFLVSLTPMQEPAA
jgi:hypothetical protein